MDLCSRETCPQIHLQAGAAVADHAAGPISRDLDQLEVELAGAGAGGGLQAVGDAAPLDAWWGRVHHLEIEAAAVGAENNDASLVGLKDAQD